MKRKTIALAVVLVLVIAAAGAVYPKLTAMVEQEAAAAPVPSAEPTQAPEAEPEKTEAPAVQEPAVTVQPAEKTPEATPEVAGPVMKRMAADFTCYTDGGEAVTLSSMRGKPVVVNFFASWCGPCKMEMPYFEECYKKYGDQVTFMMVNLCAFGNDTKEDGKAMVAEGGWTFPVYFDSDGEAAIDYAIRSMPTTIFVSADGQLGGRHTGMISMDVLEQTIQGMLAE